MNVFTSLYKICRQYYKAFVDKTDSITGKDLEVATRSGEIYDANHTRIFGITVKLGRTATEKVLYGRDATLAAIKN